jgi:hypothetical protein
MSHRVDRGRVRAGLLAGLIVLGGVPGCAQRHFEVDLRNASDRDLGVQLVRNSRGRKERVRSVELAPGERLVHAFVTQNRRTALAALVTIPGENPDLSAYAVPIQANRSQTFDLLVHDGVVVPVPRAR